MFKAKYVIVLILFVGSTALGNNVDDIIQTAKDSCNKTVSKAQALNLIRKLYLICTPKSKVDIGGCKIECKKSSDDATVGD